MKILVLTQGEVAIVDDCEFERLSKHKWTLRRIGRNLYGGRYRKLSEGRPKNEFIYLHQEVLGIIYVDHRDGNGLNNLRENLRPSTSAQNNSAFKRKKLAGTESRFRGVRKTSQGNWQAEIRVNKKGIYLGTFSSEIDAARAYDEAAREHFGSFACPNLPDCERLPLPIKIQQGASIKGQPWSEARRAAQ